MSYQDRGLLPLLLVLAMRELMATAKPTPHVIPALAGA